MTEADKTDAAAVTTMVQHSILPAKMAVFEEWSQRIRAACATYDGYLGAEVVRPVAAPGPDDAQTVVNIFRFDSYAHLDQWMQSQERQDLLKETRNFCAAPAQTQQYESLEFMFPQDGAGKPPPRGKMAIVTFAGLVAPVYFVPPLVAEYLTKTPILITLASLVIIVPLMVYAIMPILTRLARPWLNR